MFEIDKLKDEARKEHQEEYHDYDELLKRIFSFLDIIYNTTDLLTEAKKIANPDDSEGASEDEMVMVPRARYELLI